MHVELEIGAYDDARSRPCYSCGLWESSFNSRETFDIDRVVPTSES